jgi:exodeoxyribonuclease-3
MKIVTANVNGVRAAGRKGFFDWVDETQADVICIQETKAQTDQLTDELYHPKGYYCFYHDAQKKGYSGVALYCKNKPDEVIIGMENEEFDSEGRYIEAKFGKLSVISLYMPSGSSKEERQQAKYRCMDHMMTKLEEMKVSGRDFIVCGDWNIAHKNEDIRNWKGNLKNSGFLPEERAWLDTLFDDVGYVDAFREIEQEEHQYTWWSNRGQARANNVGWRIDYHILSPGLKGLVETTEIYREKSFSDHAPLIIDYDYICPG